jgi:acyl carrier protein
MTREDIFDELRRAMMSLFDLEASAITLESSLVEDLDLDSIDAIDLIIKMQELTGEKIDQESMKKVRTLGDIVELVAAHLARRS